MIHNLDNITFFLPTRKGSERVENKNTRQFANYKGGLIELKIATLLELNLEYKIIVSTNDELTKQVALSFNDSRIEVIWRPEELCLSTTRVEDLINYIPSIIPSGHVFWLHATTPLIKPATYFKALDLYNQNILIEKKFDSLLSVTSLQQFVWDPITNECINHDRSILKWPRTQDLRKLFEINHAFYINSIENYKNLEDRIGVRPYYFELGKLEAFDIDWEEDFEMAEIYFSYLKSK